MQVSKHDAFAGSKYGIYELLKRCHGTREAEGHYITMHWNTWGMWIIGVLDALKIV